MENENPQMALMFYGYIINYPCFNGYPFGYALISMDIHAWTCYGFSIQGLDSAIFTTVF